MTSPAANRAPIELRTAEGMLSFIDGVEDREIWIAVGMALKSEYGDSALPAWDAWSQEAANYSAPACRSSWRGFKSTTGGGGITMGTLVKYAMLGGYTFDAQNQPKVDPGELARRRAERSARAAKEQAERQALASNAEAQALKTWRQASRTGQSPSLERKSIDAAESVRFGAGGTLVVPMIRYDLPRENSLKGVQEIFADGSKKFTYGMAKTGVACRLGLPVVGDPVLVCEGYATGMTLRMAINRRYPVFVGFDAYSLPAVAVAVYHALPGSPIIICGDDDHGTTLKGLPNNVGRIQAQIAMESVLDIEPRAKLVTRTYPVFRRNTQRGRKDTDFNDLHRLEGLAEVSAQIELCLDTIQTLKNYG
jgi:putative DNA primase/helicase